MPDLLHRLQKEARITIETLRESVIAIAERVNRKVQILTIHWRTSTIHTQVDLAYQRLGNRLYNLLNQSLNIQGTPSIDPSTDAEVMIVETIGQIQMLKQELDDIDKLVRELEIETLREDLLSLQHDLSMRSALIRRVVIESEAVANGRTIIQLALPSTVRVAAIFRGPLVLPVSDQVRLRSGDIVVLLGARTDLLESLTFFCHSTRVFV